jgi:hypothetical protein
MFGKEARGNKSKCMIATATKALAEARAQDTVVEDCRCKLLSTVGRADKYPLIQATATKLNLG